MKSEDRNPKAEGRPKAEIRMGNRDAMNMFGEEMKRLPEKYYKTVVIDPPWPGPGSSRSLKGVGTVGCVLPYSALSGFQLSALRIDEICTDDADLWLWATSRNMVDAGLLMQSWGFSYAGLFIWRKHAGLGTWMRHDSEFLFRGVRKGTPVVLPAPIQTHEWPRPRRHSEKPGEAYEMIAKQSAEPRIDIFARQRRPGFDAWGNEVNRK